MASTKKKKRKRESGAEGSGLVVPDSKRVTTCDCRVAPVPVDKIPKWKERYKLMAKSIDAYSDDCSDPTNTYCSVASGQLGATSRWTTAMPGVFPTSSAAMDHLKFLSLIFLEFRSSLCYAGDYVWIWSQKQSSGSMASSATPGDKQWYKATLTQNLVASNTLKGNWNGAGKNTIEQQAAANVVITSGSTGNVLVDAAATKIKNFINPCLLSYYNNSRGVVVFNDIKPFNVTSETWAKLKTRFDYWMSTDLSALKQMAITLEPGYWQYCIQCLSGALSNTYATNISGRPILTWPKDSSVNKSVIPLLAMMYNDQNDFQRRAINNGLVKMAPTYNKRGAVSRLLYRLAADMLAVCPKNQKPPCGQLDGDKINTCRVFKKDSGGNLTLNPMLFKKRVPQQSTPPTEEQIINALAARSPNHNAMVNYLCKGNGLVFMIDLPKSPHSLIVIIRHGSIFTMGVGMDEEEIWPNRILPATCTSDYKLHIWTPDSSLALGNDSMHSQHQFRYLLPGDLVHQQNIRYITPYTREHEMKLIQIASHVVKTSTDGPELFDGDLRLTMQQSWGVYRKFTKAGPISWGVSRIFGLGHGGVNCTSFAQWFIGKNDFYPVSNPSWGNSILTGGGKKKTRRKRHKKKRRTRYKRSNPRKKTRRRKKRRRKKRRTRR